METIRINRANPNLLQSINVVTPNGTQSINSLGQIIIKDPQLLQVTLYDESLLKDVEKAVRSSPLGLTPVIESNTLKIKIPK